MKNSLITMSAIVGKPTKDECFNYLQGLKENGISAAMLYPRSGCEIEYLSEEWFRIISDLICAAENLDMDIWLYDDFNWPSGDACGKVTEIDNFRSRAIETEGETIGEISYSSKHNTVVFNEKFFPNLLSEDAVDYFIETTHEQYYKRFGKYFGNVIKGIFTDEPSFAYTCEGTKCPWYEGIEEDYKDRFKRDYTEDLYNSKQIFKVNSYKLASDKFHHCFVNKIAIWCHNHGIFLTGHFMNDSSPYSAVKYNGDFLKNLSVFSLPGIDFIETNLKTDILLNLLASAEYASGSEGAIAELFALGPADMSYAKKRCMIYLCAAFKINRYFLAVSAMDFRGNAFIKDYFIPFTNDQPDFKGMKILAKEADIASDIALKDYTADVYILYPRDISYENIGIQMNHSIYFVLLNQLSKNQIQWKFVNSKDECIGRPLIEFGREYQYYLDGKLYPDADSVCNALKVVTYVTDINGNIPDGLFVRRYDDGEILVINLYAPKGVYLVNRTPYDLDEFGVIYTGSTEKHTTSECVKQINSEFSLNYCNSNMIRTMYINGQKDSEVICNSDMTVQFAVRNNESLLLDGEEIVCNITNSELLSRGFRKLYKVSDEIKLSCGKHILTSDNDIKYLPSVFIIGDFAQHSTGDIICKTELCNRKASYTAGEYFDSFGKVEYNAEIKVPADASKLKLSGTKLLTEVYINNVLVETQYYEPYNYALCDSYKGENINLKIVQYSSIGPIFGDDKYYSKNSKAVLWKNAPYITETKYGFEKIEFIK